MAANPFANASQAAINEIENLALSALPTVAVAILALVAAIVGFWFAAKLFGFNIGLSETAKQRIRTKVAKRNAAFPFAFSKRSAKVAAEGGPWRKPNSFEEQYSSEFDNYDFDSLDQSNMFFSNVVSPDLNFSMELDDALRAHLGIPDRALSQDEIFQGLKGIFMKQAAPVYDAWDRTFSHIGNIKGLLDSNLDIETKSYLFMHASRVAALKLKAMAENEKEWAKQYGDGMAPTQSTFVA